MAGLHRGRINLSTGLLEPYLVIDLPTKDEILADDAFVPSSMDQDTLQRIYKGIKASSNPILSYKINLFLDRFLYIVSSATPYIHQRDIDEKAFNIMTFGIVAKPPAFYLPSSYLAYTVFFDDIRIHSDGTQWFNDGDWKPATNFSSPIELFPYSAACRAANVILPSDSRVSQPQPSTSSACASTQNLSKATKTKSKSKRKSEPNVRKKTKAARPNPQPPILNVSPEDCVSLPDIILDLDDEERFIDSDDSDVEVLSQSSSSSSQALQIIPSPSYSLNATSDVTTQRLTPRLTPGSTTGSSSQCDTPDYADFRPNPLATAPWSSDDEL